MKKFLYAFLILILATTCMFFVGCESDKYGGLSMSVSFSYSSDKAQRLDNGVTRVTTSDGVYDINPDGSYTMYIDSASTSKADVEIKFSGAPGDFAYRAAYEIDNEIVAVSGAYRSIEKGVKTTIRALSQGQAVVTFKSVEGGKSQSIHIKVVEIPSNIEFAKENISLINSANSQINLHDLVVNRTSSNFSYSLGYTDDNADFIAYKGDRLASHGLNYNASTGVLSVVGTETDLEEILLKVSCTTPLGQTITSTKKIDIVYSLEDFEVYFGSSQSDIIEGNLVTESTLQNFVNISGLNYCDVMLVVKNHGQEVTMSYIASPYAAVEFRGIKYIDGDGAEVTSPALGVYALQQARVMAGKNTEGNISSNYYILTFSCDYKNVVVDDYPIYTTLKVKTYEVVKKYSINGVEMPDTKITDDLDGNVYNQNIYFNTDPSLDGASFTVGVAEPTSISSGLHSNFKIKFYNKAKQEIAAPGDIFSIKCTLPNGTSMSVGVDDILTANSTISVKMIRDSLFSAGEQFYIELTSTTPEQDDYKTSAVVCLTVVEGIKEIKSVDYVQGEQNGHIIFEDYVSTEAINVDGYSTTDVDVTVNYIAATAAYDNLIVEALDPSIIEIEQDEQYKYNFTIKPLSLGSTSVVIYTTNLHTKNYLAVNVYSPISDFKVSLADASYERGVSDYKTDIAGNLQEVLVQQGKNIPVRLSILPASASQYQVQYKVEKYDEEQNLVLVGSIDYTYDEFVSLGDNDEHYIIDEDLFTFNTLDNTFSFLSESSTREKYVLTVTIVNLDGSEKTSSFALNSYIPTSLRLDMPKDAVYNPNTISYYSKLSSISSTDYASDNTAFSIRATQRAIYGSASPTFDFARYGKISFIVNGVVDSWYEVVDGDLVVGNSNIVSAIETYSVNNYYWFRLNPDYSSYDYTDGRILVEISLKEEYIDSAYNLVTDYGALRILNAEKISSLSSSVAADEELYFEKGITPEQKESIRFPKESAYNKNLEHKVFTVLNIGSQVVYALADDEVNATNNFAAIKTSLTKKTSYYELAVSAKNEGVCVIFVMPQDNIVTQADYDLFNNKTLVPVVFGENDTFYKNVFYLDSQGQNLATSAQVGETYYIYQVDLAAITNRWHNYVDIAVSVADGIDVPYHISSIESLRDYISSELGASKKYVLTSDLSAVNITNWTPIASYYEAPNNGTKLPLGAEFYLDDDGQIVTNNKPYDRNTIYYGYGFNGSLSGKWTITNATGTIDRYFGISGINFNAGSITTQYGGLFATLGEQAHISDLKITYNFFEGTLSTASIYSYTFGGLAGISYAQDKDLDQKFVPSIQNVAITYDTLNLSTSSSSINIVFGGLVGKNYGFIDNSSQGSTLEGIVNITINLPSSTETMQHLAVGGLVGENYGIIKGSFDYKTEYDILSVNNSGYSSVLTINILGQNAVADNSKSGVGGAVGYNEGIIKNIAIDGFINAAKIENVGGLVGFGARGDWIFVGEEYDYIDCYSIARVRGNRNVGGAIGAAKGKTESPIKLYYVSAENYVDNSKFEGRPLAQGSEKVGGFAGDLNSIELNYCYAVSYYNLYEFEDDLSSYNDGFDVVATNGNAGGFAYSLNACSLFSCASALNVYAFSSASIFASDYYNNPADSVLAHGHCFGQTTLNALGFDIASFSSVSGDSYSASIGSDGLLSFYINQGDISSTRDAIISTVTGSRWGRDDSFFGGLPYLTFSYEVSAATIVEPLLVIGDINVGATVNDNNLADPFVSYIKVSDDTVILFLNIDEKGLYSAAAVKNLNYINIFDGIVSLSRFKTHKTAQVKLSSTTPRVVSVLSNGYLVVSGEGIANLRIESKLNKDFHSDIIIVVKYGLNGINLYQNNAFTNPIDGETIDVLEGSDQPIFVETSYTRELYGIDAELKSIDDLGIRFAVKSSSLPVGTEINNLFTFKSSQWKPLTIGTESYFVSDVDSKSKELQAIKSFAGTIEVEYLPYIRVATEPNQVVYLDYYKGSFDLTISSGATDIRLGDNSSGVYSINQHESIVFVVTIVTDKENDEIADNSSSFTALDSNFLLTRGRVVKTYNTSGQIVSISQTFTFTYNDKVNSISLLENNPFLNSNKTQLNYILPSGAPLQFYAVSNPMLVVPVYITVASKDTLDDMQAFVYSDIYTDYPHNPSENRIIYRDQTPALLAIETYPFFATYSRLRISYTNANGYPLQITQVEYMLDGTSEEQFVAYHNSSEGVLYAEKSTAQDTYKSNEENVYSYAKSYFFSLLCPSLVQEEISFTILIEVLNRANVVIDSRQVTIRTLVKPSLTISIDEKYKGNDGNYYLPYNTLNEIFVTKNNASGDVDWTVTFDKAEYNATNYEKTKIRECLTPKLVDGKYYVQVMKYISSGNSENINDIAVIGERVTLTAVVSNENSVSEPVSISFYITTFTVRDIDVVGIDDNGVLSLQASSYEPIKVTVDAYYDTALTTREDNWYSDWFSRKDGGLKEKIEKSNYVLDRYFVNYISQLEDMIAKAKLFENISSVWYYVSSTGSGEVSQLVVGTVYDEHLTIEMYNNYFALYSDRVDKTFNLMLKPNIDYKGANNAAGVPTIKSWSEGSAALDPTATSTFSSFEKRFIVSFTFYTEFLNPIPVSTKEEFLEMENKTGQNYRLVNDILLDDYSPIVANMASFDGNGYNIYITGFSYQSNQRALPLGLFKSVENGTVVCNTTAYYIGTVESETVTNEHGVQVTTYYPTKEPLYLSIDDASSLSFGGITPTNRGTITNATVTGSINISLSGATETDTTKIIDSSTTAGLVCNNDSTGYITNSKVYDLSLVCQGSAGGFVGSNSGLIVASYFDNSSLQVVSKSNAAGFALSNTGRIYECYSQGKRLATDTTIQNTGDGVTSNGEAAAGFVYSNSGKISDCYANTHFASSKVTAGFVFVDQSSSEIVRCYSISYKTVGDNTTTAFPFAGPTSSEIQRIEIKGILDNCYYLSGGDYEDTNFYIPGSDVASDTPASKKATPLSYDNFATHTYFTDYDLSLEHKTERIGNTEAKYADGYTWVIMEGKPVLVSTLTPTVSNQVWQGKIKTYSDIKVYFDSGEQLVKQDDHNNFYLVDSVDQSTEGLTPAYTRIENDVKNDHYILYMFAGDGDYKNIYIKYSYTKEGSVITLGDIIACEYKDSFDGEGVILDWEEYNLAGESISGDRNFRANNTVEIYRDENGYIYSIKYMVTDQVKYSYAITTGTRINPILIYNYDSFCYEFTRNSGSQKFYRYIEDIDLNKNLVSTSYASFAGVMQGNHMIVDNIYLSYTNIDPTEQNNRAFGLFATITTKVGQGDTIISNLSFKVAHVASHAHDFVGALAGQIISHQIENIENKILINNVSILGTNDSTGVFGVHSTGGLAGFMRGNIILKNISSSINATSYYEQSNTLVDSMLYIDRDDTNNLLASEKINVSKLSYAGGIAGIFDVNEIEDTSTRKNFGATNISVSGECAFSGTIVGSVFGLVGPKAIVNYASTIVSSSSKAHIVALGYGGGLVGENRGKIYRSYIMYDGEKNTNKEIGSRYSENDYFYNVNSKRGIAIGGLVGLNNGGTISNCLTTIDVHNASCKIAGGAVGRLVGGTMEYVVASGSVYASGIMGGLVGVACRNSDMIVTAGYNLLAITSQVTSTISNCVAENNYVKSEYAYYRNIMSSTLNGMVAGFIGLVVKDPATSGDDIYGYINFGGKPNYYSNVLYSTASNTVYHLDAAYSSSTFDTLARDGQAIIFGQTTNDVFSQYVIPYSVEEMYHDYDSTYNPLALSYIVRQEDNMAESIENTEAYRQSNIYRITYSSPSYLKNDDSFYTKIGPDSVFGDDDGFNRAVACYNYIYYKDGNVYKEVTTKEVYDAQYYAGGVYYLSTAVVDNFDFTKTFGISVNVVGSSEKHITGNKVLFGNLTREQNKYTDCMTESIPVKSGGEVIDGLYPKAVSGDKLYLQQDGDIYAVRYGTTYYYKDSNGDKVVLNNLDPHFDYAYFQAVESGQTTFDEPATPNKPQVHYSATNLKNYINDTSITSPNKTNVILYYNVAQTMSIRTDEANYTENAIWIDVYPADSSEFADKEPITASMHEIFVDNSGYTGNNFVSLIKPTSTKYIAINGIKIDVSSCVLVLDVSSNIGRYYKELNGNIDPVELEIPYSAIDNTDITGLSFRWAAEEVSTGGYTYNITSVSVTYNYKNVAASPSVTGPVSLVSSDVGLGPGNTRYTLTISARRNIFGAFDNGSWAFGENFYSSDYNTVDKYPLPKDLADTYLWSDFAEELGGGGIVQHTTITTAEQLAALANSVNEGYSNYAAHVIHLNADIDLSGKYWIPIGTASHPFKGKFDGNGHSIKFLSVNENSNGGQLLEYAGLFGYVEGATICNLKIVGGESVGYTAGAVAGYAKNTQLSNILSGNNVQGVLYAGGIVGQMEDAGSEESTIINVTNRGSVTLDTAGAPSTPITQSVYVGGIIGNSNKVVFDQEVPVDEQDYNISGIYNYGNISIKDSKTVYISSSKVYLSVYVGGIIGNSQDDTISCSLSNMGKIEISSNAHVLYVGGVIGNLEMSSQPRTATVGTETRSIRTSVVTGLVNTGKGAIDITYFNSCKDENICQTSFVGGVVGYSTCSLFRCRNEATIDFALEYISSNYIVIGGVVGELNPHNADNVLYNTEDEDDIQTPCYVAECFNAGDITHQTSTEATFFVGGVIGSINLASASANSTDTTDRLSKALVRDCYNAGDIDASGESKIYCAGVVGSFYFRFKDEKASNFSIAEGSEELLTITRTMNIGQVELKPYVTGRTCVAAIVCILHGLDANNATYINQGSPYVEGVTPGEYFHNFYLAGSAKADGNAKSGTYIDEPNGDTFCKSLSSTSLKDNEMFDVFSSDIWEQKYDTWFLTLRHNPTSIMWEDKTTEVSRNGNTYYVSTAQQLAYLAARINSGALNSADIIIKLSASIDLSSRYWTPIGNETFPFKGVFDGDNRFSVRFLTIDGSSLGNINYGGLFGYIEDATIKNVGIESPIIGNVDYAAAIAFNAANSYITGIFTERGESASSKISATREVAGIVTRLHNSVGARGLYNSYNNVPVYLNSSTEFSIGALVYLLDGANMSDCYNNVCGTINNNSDKTDSSVIQTINDHLIVVGSTQNSSTVTNVFNLACPIFETDIVPTLYEMQEEEVRLSEKTPIYDNLIDNGNKSKVWLNSYSLNTDFDYSNGDNANKYPSLRNMNREWKNNLSDSLQGYTVGSDYSSVRDAIKVYSHTSLVTFGSEILAKNVQNVYLISSAEDLALLAQNVNSRTLDSQNTEFILMTDIDLAGRYWTPIGLSKDCAFKGIFNFNGHVIKNLTIDSNSLTYVGLFGYTSGAYIIDGYMQNAFVRVQSSLEMSKTFAGALIGYAENTSVRNMYIGARVTGQAVSTIYVGGAIGAVVGKQIYHIKNVVINSTTDTFGVDLFEYESKVYQNENDNTSILPNRVQVFAVSTGNKAYAGGLAGYIEGNPSSQIQQADRKFEILNVTNNANVAAVATWTSNAYVGGILGYGTNYLTISLCKNNGQVKGYSGDNDMVGGIVGYLNKSSITDCGNYGYIEGRLSVGISSGFWSYVGGIVGVMVDGNIGHCVNIGSTYAAYTATDVSLGGIMGYSHSEVAKVQNGSTYYFRDLTQDKRCVYKAKETGFFTPNKDNLVMGSIGYFDPSSDAEYVNSLEELFGANTDNTADIVDWTDSAWSNDGKLNNSLIFIIGCGEPTFAVAEPSGYIIAGSAPGFYKENLNDVSTVKLNYENGNGSIVIGFVVERYGVLYSDAPTSTAFSSSPGSAAVLQINAAGASDKTLVIIIALETE